MTAPKGIVKRWEAVRRLSITWIIAVKSILTEIKTGYLAKMYVASSANRLKMADINNVLILMSAENKG